MNNKTCSTCALWRAPPDVILTLDQHILGQETA